MEVSDSKSCSIEKKPLLLGGWLLLLGWIIIAILLDLFWIELWNKNWLFVILFRFLLWLGFAMIAVYSIVPCVIRRAKLASFCLLITVILVGFCYGRYGADLRFQLRFQVLKRSYESAIVSIVANNAPSSEIEYKLDQGCIAFPCQSAPLGRWAGVLYDPGGLLMRKKNAPKNGHSSMGIFAVVNHLVAPGISVGSLEKSFLGRSNSHRDRS